METLFKINDLDIGYMIAISYILVGVIVGIITTIKIANKEDFKSIENFLSYVATGIVITLSSTMIFPLIIFFWYDNNNE